MFLILVRALVVLAFLASAFLLGRSIWQPQIALASCLYAAGILALLPLLLFGLERATRSILPLLDWDEAGWFLGRMIRVPFRWVAILAPVLALGRWGLSGDRAHLFGAAALAGYLLFFFLVLLLLRILRPVPGMDYR